MSCPRIRRHYTPHPFLQRHRPEHTNQDCHAWSQTHTNDQHTSPSPNPFCRRLLWQIESLLLTAMQLFLNKIHTYQIMLLGRWSSDALLRYIRRQVQEFSEGLSDTMIKKEFFMIPDVETSDSQDPRTRNTASFSMASSNDSTILGARFPVPAVSTWS